MGNSQYTCGLGFRWLCAILVIILLIIIISSNDMYIINKVLVGFLTVAGFTLIAVFVGDRINRSERCSNRAYMSISPGISENISYSVGLPNSSTTLL